MTVVALPLSNGGVTYIDHWNRWVEQYTWSLDAHGYAHAYLGRSHGVNHYEYLHTLIVAPPPGMTVDHIDRDPLNNVEDNLRLATKGQQMFNMGLPCTNTSGFKGVTFHKQSGRWRAQIGVHGRRIALGLYSTPEAAAEAWDEGALRYHGEFACTNRMLGLLP